MFKSISALPEFYWRLTQKTCFSWICDDVPDSSVFTQRLLTGQKKSFHFLTTINVPLRHRLTSQTDLSARWSVSYDSWYSCASSPHHPPHVRRYTQGCDFNFMQICPVNLPPQETLAPFKKRRFSQAMWYWAVFIFIFSVNCVLLCRSRWPTGCENMLVGKAGVADLRSVIHRWRWWSCTWSIKSIKRNKLFLNLLTPRASLLMKTVCFDPI